MTPGRSALVSLTIEGGVAVLTLDDAGKRNAIGTEMARAIVDACDAIDASACGAALVRGAGGYFCAGADRALLAAVSAAPTPEDGSRMLDAVYAAFTRVGAMRMPVVAAIRGGAVGAGLNLALAADARIIADTATLVSGFLPLRIHQGGGQSYLLGSLAGREAASAMIVFGEPVTGTRARELGLAWEAVPDAEVDPRAMELARSAASDPELARQMIATVRGSRTADWAAKLDEERERQLWSLRRLGRTAGVSR
jgi:enoyl-CoA hydratase